MMRSLILFIGIVVVYYALKAVLRSAIHGYSEKAGRPSLKGEEMVLDPQCRTYVVKDRSVTRRIRGSVYSFCSDSCARKYEDEQRLTSDS